MMHQKPRFRKPSFLILALLCVSLFTISGCNSTSDTTHELRIGLIPTEDNTLFYVADHDNLFAQAGLNVTFIDFVSAQERDAALQAKQIDGEITDLMTVALQKKTGADISILSLCLGATPAEGRFCLIAAPGSNLKIPADLAGADIGIAQNTITEYVATRLLDSAGIAPADRVLMPVSKIPDRLSMVLQGTLDAGIFPEPLASYAISQGGVLILDDTQFDISQTVFFLTNTVLNTYPEKVKTLMEVLAEARTAYMADPEKYRTLIVDRAKVPEALAATYSLPTFSPLQAPLQSNFNDVMSWMVEKGVLSQAYAYDDLVNSSFLPGGAGSSGTPSP